MIVFEYSYKLQPSLLVGLRVYRLLPISLHMAFYVSSLPLGQKQESSFELLKCIIWFTITKMRHIFWFILLAAEKEEKEKEREVNSITNIYNTRIIKYSVIDILKDFVSMTFPNEKEGNKWRTWNDSYTVLA